MNNIRLFWKLFFSLYCLLLTCTVFSAELKPYHFDKNPDFSLSDLSGKIHQLSDYRGKVVLINFWASWCPPCIYEMPELQRLQMSLKGQPFEILAINAGEKKYKVRKFSKMIKLELPVLIDPQKSTFNKWYIKSLPTSFLVDENGIVRYKVRGNPGWERIETRSIIEKMMPADNSEELTNQ